MFSGALERGSGRGNGNLVGNLVANMQRRCRRSRCSSLRGGFAVRLTDKAIVAYPAKSIDAARHNTLNEMYHARARVHLDRRRINQTARHLRQGSHQPSHTQSSRQRRKTNICVVAQDIGKSEISNDAGGSHRMRFTMRVRVDSMTVASNKPRAIHTRGRQCRTTNILVLARDIGRAEGGLQRPCHQSLRRGATLMLGKNFVDNACCLLLQGRRRASHARRSIAAHARRSIWFHSSIDRTLRGGHVAAGECCVNACVC